MGLLLLLPPSRRLVARLWAGVWFFFFIVVVVVAGRLPCRDTRWVRRQPSGISGIGPRIDGCCRLANRVASGANPFELWDLIIIVDDTKIVEGLCAIMSMEKR